MNIPLDRLYHYIENVSEKIYGERVLIYRFSPHGSKNIENLVDFKHYDWVESASYPMIWCNDQEPLNYEYYSKNLLKNTTHTKMSPIMSSLNLSIPVSNLNYKKNIFSKGLLLHSEKRSSNVDAYETNGELIPVYYWSHAIIARDWFRYAEHVPQQKQIQKTFLIYNRAWSGTREYRLKFAELLIKLGLQDHCKTSINPVEPELGIHYELHKFQNASWRPTVVLENFFPTSTAHSHYSADFDIEDYEATDIEIVLETLFDDQRLHLTEKSLRPIACGQPFILAGTQGSLEYLRSYGFKTFGLVWDEHYDECANPEERLERMADLMKQIANWGPWLREQKIAEARAIAEYNRQHFFSKEFFNQIVNELETNISLAIDQLQKLPVNQEWIGLWEIFLNSIEGCKFLENNKDLLYPTRLNLERVFDLAKNKFSANLKL